MATIHPAIGNMPHPVSAGEYAERELIHLLAQAFSDNYLVFHHVDWSRQGAQHQAWLGELDVVLVNGHGDMAVIELKSGQLEVVDGRLFKEYRHHRKDVINQFVHQRSGLRARLNDAHLHDIQPLHLLVLPDFRILNASSLVGLNEEELVDAQAFGQLVDRLRRHLPEHALTPRGEAVRRFLLNWLDLVPDIQFRKESLGQVTRQLADGLATWVPRIVSPAGLYLVNATAGCGKTQMSLDILNKAVASGRKALYLCYNRPLADRMRSFFSPRVTVCNYDDLCMETYRRQTGEPDFSQPGVFRLVQQAFLACEPDAAAGFDVIIIDEAQDFEPDWIGHLLNARLRDGGSAYVLQDEEQRIYERPAFELNDAVVIHCDDNFRTPQNIVALIQLLGLTQRKIRPRSALQDGELTWFTYSDERSLLKQTGAMVDHFLEKGFTADDILIATGRGQENSVVLRKGLVGPHTLRRPTREYDANHEPVWTDGVIQTDTLYRTKGQSAPVVILTELDFDALDGKAARLLFVGLTRASMGVGMVLSERARRVIEQRMDGLT